MYGDHYTEMCLPAAKSVSWRCAHNNNTTLFRLRDAIIRGIQKKIAAGAIIAGREKVCCGRFLLLKKCNTKKLFFLCCKKKRKNYAPTCVGAKMHTWVPCSVRAKMHTCVDVYTHPREGVNVRRFDAEIICFFGPPT